MVGGKEKEGANLLQDAHTYIMKGIFSCLGGRVGFNVCSAETELAGVCWWVGLTSQELRGWKGQV